MPARLRPASCSGPVLPRHSTRSQWNGEAIAADTNLPWCFPKSSSPIKLAYRHANVVLPCLLSVVCDLFIIVRNAFGVRINAQIICCGYAKGEQKLPCIALRREVRNGEGPERGTQGNRI